MKTYEVTLYTDCGPNRSEVTIRVRATSPGYAVETAQRMWNYPHVNLRDTPPNAFYGVAEVDA